MVSPWQVVYAAPQRRACHIDRRDFIHNNEQALRPLTGRAVDQETAGL
jgi:hypothetical protein